MSLVDAVAAAMFAAVIAYAVLGGADFGSGIWDLVAGRDEEAGSMRRLIDRSIGPVWEANHVWLIVVLVILWTAFPTSYAVLVQTLAIPFWLVGLGISLRGAVFAFRKVAPTFRFAQAAGAVFALSSLMTPFFLGVIAGAVASGRIRLDEPPERLSSWLTVTSLVGGVLAVLACAFIAGVFLAAEASDLGQTDLADELRRKALILGIGMGVVAIAAILPLARDAPTLVEGLTGRGLAAVATSAIGGSASLALLFSGRLREARIGAAVAVGSIVLGWGLAQYPWLLVDEITIADAAGARGALVGLIIASGLAAVLVLPPLIYLFLLASSDGPRHKR